MGGKPKISNIEWGLVIGALFTVDLIQIVLDLFVIGAIVNRFVDVFIGLSFGLYMQLRGQSLANPKRLFALLATFTGEMIPVVDALPLWGLDGVIAFFIAKGEATLEKNPVIGKIVQTGSRLAGERGKLTHTIENGVPVTQSKAYTPITPRHRADFIAEATSKTTALRYGLNPDEVVKETRRRNQLNSLPNDIVGGRVPTSNQRIPSANYPGTPGSKENNGKTNSMSIHDELWELNAKPNLNSEDKERLLKAHWIMEHKHIGDKEKNDPVLLRAWERVNRGEVIFDGSPEKRHGFKFSNVQIVNATNTIAGRDFASLNPQYGSNGKSGAKS